MDRSFIVIQPDELTPYKSIVFYDTQTKYFILTAKYEGRQRYVKNRNVQHMHKLITGSYIDIDLEFNYSIYFPKLKKKKLLGLLGKTDSKKKIKTNLHLFLDLLRF